MNYNVGKGDWKLGAGTVMVVKTLVELISDKNTELWAALSVLKRD